jgi:O-antigen/teichoic acid export membrane protein
VFLDADKWHDLPPVLGVLGLGMVFRLLDEPMQALIAAQGRFRLGFYLSLGSSALYLAICALGSVRGVALETATAVAAYYVVAGPAVLTVAIRRGGGTLMEALKVFLVPFALAVCAIGPWLLLTRGLVAHGRGENALLLLTVIVGSIMTYLALGRAVSPPGWAELVSRVHDIAPRRLKRLVARIAGTSLEPEPLSAHLR